MTRRTGSTPLDDFLAGADDSTSTGELLEQVGLLMSMLGLLLATGLIVFLAVVHRGRRAEVATLLRVVALAAAVAVVGAAIEIAGLAAIDDLGWIDALTDGGSAAAMMRLLAGAMVALGLFDHSVDIESPVADESADGEVADPPGGDGLVRWTPASASAFAYAGVALAMFSFAFDGHTVTEGPRGVHAGVDIVHVSAAAIWFGGIVGLALVGWLRRTDGSTAALTVRFSTVATVALVLVALAGSLMSLMIIDGPSDLTTTEWGRTLLVKLGAVAMVASIGAYNHFVVVPALETGDSDALVRRARMTVTVEAGLLVAVVAISMLLVGASTV